MHTHRVNRLFVACLLAVVPWLVGAQAADETTQWQLVEEHWYSVRMGDLGSGWMRTAVHRDGERFRSSSSMQISISRMGDAGEISGESTFIERADGTPLEMTSRQVMSAQAMQGRWVFEDGKVTHVSRQGERETTREVDWPEGVWLTPRGVSRFLTERIEAEAKEVTYRMLTPENGLTPVKVTSRREGSATYSYAGKEVPVSVWKTTTSIMPIESVEHYTADGTLVFQETPTGIGVMSMKRVSKADALDLELVEVPGGMLPRTFIRPSSPIERPMQARRATLVLNVKQGEMPPLPEAGSQRVTKDGHRATLVIDIDDPLPATENEIADAAYRDASPMIDSDDSMVKALTRRALKDAGLSSEDDPAKRAEALRAYVHTFITNPNLDVPFASASETARTRSGDCSEFGVLLAAMLRADGIAARVASGLVYADQFAGSDDIFGWHMWTQALIDGHWVDYDATLPTRYHAGHVLTGTSSLADGQGATEMASMIMLMGNLEIDVQDVGY